MAKGVLQVRLLESKNVVLPGKSVNAMRVIIYAVS